MTAAVVLCAIAIVGCTATTTDPPLTPLGEHADSAVIDPPQDKATPDHPGTVCSTYFEDVRHAQFTTVAQVRNVGPTPINPPPGPLDAYADDEPVALCLVPDGPEFAAMVVVLSDGTTLARWKQNVDDDFSWPI